MVFSERYPIHYIFSQLFQSKHLEVACSSHSLLLSCWYILCDDNLSVLCSDPDLHCGRTCSARIQPVVVDLSCTGFPGCSVVGRELQLRDGLVGVIYLDGKPILRATLLSTKLEGSGDRAVDVIPSDWDLASHFCSELGESVFEEIKCLSRTPAWALIHNLD